MIVSSRIKTIGDFIEKGEKVADIGADHGLLELYLIAKYRDIFILAIENKKGPFAILDHNLRGFKNVRLSLTDGISYLEPGIQTLVLAGMGGLNIKKILDTYPEKLEHIKKVIVDAHRDIPVVRKTLIDYGFKISTEKIVYEDDKFYVINVFTKPIDKEKYSDDEIDFGYKIYEDKLWPKYKKFLIKRNTEVIKELRRNSNNQNKILKLKNINERIRKYGKEQVI